MRRLAVLLSLGFTCVGIAPAQWAMEDSHSTADLRGIDNVGGGVVWASGTNGTVLRSEDAGYLWQTCAVPPGAEKLDFRGIQGFDANTAIVMSSGKGDLSRLYKTTDGCATWKLAFTNPDPDGFWDAIRFGGPRPWQEGILIGDPLNGRFSIFQSSDGGSNWRRWGGRIELDGGVYKEHQSNARSGSVLFAASNQELLFWGGVEFGFVTGGTSGADLVYTDDGRWCEELGGICNVTFQRIKLPMLASGPASGAFAIACKSPCSFWPLRLMIVGGDYEHPDKSQGNAVFASSRDGVHMPFTSHLDLRISATPPHGYRSAVAYYAALNTWITVGPNGTDISTDDGRNWRALHPDASLHEATDADRNWNALSLPFVVGPHGRIGRLDPAALRQPDTSKP